MVGAASVGGPCSVLRANLSRRHVVGGVGLARGRNSPRSGRLSRQYGEFSPGRLAMRLLVWGASLLALSGSPAIAGERIDLFDAQGRRTGYAIVDRESARVDFHDVNSRRTGWGRLDSMERIEEFALSGQRDFQPATWPRRSERRSR